LESLTELKSAVLADFNTISYTLTPKTNIASLDQVKVYADGQPVSVSDISTLGKEALTGNITLAEKIDLTKTYSVEIQGVGAKTAFPMGIFDCDEFVENYTYSGDDLGAVIQGTATTFKVWAPTASKVVLNLYTAGNDCDAFETVEMTRGDRGVWQHTQENCGHGTYYTYTVTTSVGTQEATDPYARAAGVNGNRSMVVDLSTTDPENWDESFKTGITSYSQAVIWEVHVRDFSNTIADSQHKGKYLAFTERGLKNENGIPVGVDYLVDLGVTHVHLLPVYDYATVDETKLDTPQFNWGYDPKNYNVPEGSYSTDPYHGEVRIKEYKQMVQGLHDAGLGVIMDVVYNHTYDGNSAFNKLVPYYYYRYSPTGANTSASGCGNDTASERYMFGKFMADSVRYWAEEYHLDGFRFDLMGLHDLATMQKVEAAIHEVNPEALIYGEGWNMGATMDGSPQANQGNIGKIEKTNGAIGTIAVFNDVIRDGLKGSVFETTSKGYISGAGSANAGKVRFGISGGNLSGYGWRVPDSMVINYMSAHDNHSLWDKLALSNSADTPETRAEMNRLGAAVLMISRGTPFFQAGEEMLRSKDGDENSYKSSDEINNIRWDTLTPDSEAYRTMEYYRGLIAMRRAYGAFRYGEVSFTDLGDGRLEIRFGESALAVINPTGGPFSYTLEEDWNLVADEAMAGSDAIRREQGEITVAARSIRIYVK
jgi:pullulanase